MKTKALLCVLLGLQLFTSTVFSQFVAHRRARHFNARDAGAATVLDSRFISGVAAAADLATWSSRTGSNDATEATNKPTFEMAIQGGQPAVRFNGSSDLLTMSALDVDGEHIFIYTFILRGTGTGDGYAPVISYMPDGGSDRGAPLYAKSDNTWASYPRYTGVPGNDNFDGNGAWSTGVPYVARFIYPTPAAVWSVKLNGVALGSGDSTGAAAGNGILLARQATPSRYAQVDILQLVAAPQTWTDALINRCEHSVKLAFKLAD